MPRAADVRHRHSGRVSMARGGRADGPDAPPVADLVVAARDADAKLAIGAGDPVVGRSDGVRVGHGGDPDTM